LELEVIDLFGVDQDVLSFGVLVALHDFLVWHLGEGFTVMNTL
jgi:hypothetical protein